jgi:hypothetical protein
MIDLGFLSCTPIDFIFALIIIHSLVGLFLYRLFRLRRRDKINAPLRERANELETMWNNYQRGISE